MLEELFDMMKENCGGDEKQIIELGNELLEYMIKSKDFTYEFSKRLELFADQNNRCSTCGEEIEYKTSAYEESEYEGFSVTEEIGEKYCSNCGYIE